MATRPFNTPPTKVIDVFDSMSTYENTRIDLSEIVKDYASSHIEGYGNFSSTLINWFEEIANSFIKYNGNRRNKL